MELPANNSDLAQADDDLSRKQSLNSPTKLNATSPKEGTSFNSNWGDNNLSPARSLSGSQAPKQQDGLDQSFGVTQSSAANLLPLDDKLPEEIYTSLYV